MHVLVPRRERKHGYNIRMDFYDPSRIGRRIAFLGEHTVYMYGEREVIKFSRLTKLFGGGEIEYLRRDLEIGQKYFGEYMVPTRIATLSDGSKPALMQPFVRGRILKKSDLIDPRVRMQYREIVERHQRMVADGHSPIDLMSGMGFLLGRPRNIFLTDSMDVRLIDVMSVDMLSPFFRLWIQARQDKILTRFAI